MRKIQTTATNEITVKNISGYFNRSINKFGTGAKIDAPKEYLGKKVIVLVCKD
jgi:putative transposon-encoded protein